MKRMLISMALFAICCATLAQTATQGASQHGWRGPQNNGLYPDTGLLDTWPEGGPELVFEVEDAGKGYSSAQVVGDRIYLTGLNDQEDQDQKAQDLA